MRRPYTSMTRSSRRRYREFIRHYRLGRLDEVTQAAGEQKSDEAHAGNRTATASAWRSIRSGPRRDYLGQYVRWLKPYRARLAAVFVLALAAAGLQMIEPLFMRFIVDRVLLDRALDRDARLIRLDLAGAVFLSVILLTHV